MAQASGQPNPALARALGGIRVGATAILVIQSPQGPEELRTRVEDLVNGQLLLAMPTRRGDLVLLRQGEAVLLVIQAANGTQVLVRGVVVDRRILERLPVVIVRPLHVEQQQRRRHFRIDTSIAPTTCAMWQARPGEPGQWVSLTGRIVNLSGGGAGMLLDQGIEAGQRLQLRFELPSRQGLVAATAKVVWVQPPEAPRQTRYRAGVTFENVPAPERERLVRALYRYQLELRQEGRI